MPWYLYLALKQLFPTGRRFGSFFFAVSVLGVGLGVMVLVIVQSVMGGFGAVHRERIVETTGHIDVRQGGRPFADYQPIVERVRAETGVTAASPYAVGPVMLELAGQREFPLGYGLEPGNGGGFALGQFLQYGDIDDLDDERVFLSRSLAARLGAYIGDVVEVYSPSMIESLGGTEVVLPRSFQVAGIFDIEWNEQLSPGVIFTLRAMQDLLGTPGLINGIVVRVGERVDEFAVADRLREDLRPWSEVLTWKDVWADFLWVLDLEKTMMLFLNLFIVAVAVFAIAIAQLLTVVRKTREIGLLGAVGARTRSVLLLYASQGFLIGMAGTVLGIALALLFLSFRDPIIGFISSATGTRDTLIRFYYFSHLPVQYAARDFIVITVSALSLSTAAGLIPAIRAARMKPADALRTDG